MNEFRFEHPDKYLNQLYVRGLDFAKAKELMWALRDDHEDTLRVSSSLLKDNTVVLESLDARDIQSDTTLQKHVEQVTMDVYWGRTETVAA